MSIARQLPKTDEGRNKALTTAKTKKDNTAAADMPLTAATITRLDAIQPSFKDKLQERNTALQSQSSLTALVKTVFTRCKMFVSHFIQGFNNGVDRAVFKPADRAFYGLDVSSDSVPKMSNNQDLTLWASNVITGEVKRIAAGGTKMPFPTSDEVQAELTDFSGKNTQHSTAKDAYDKSQEAVAKLRTEADAVILKVWDEVETFFNEDEPSSRRRKAREWGVVYVSSSATVIDGLITSSNPAVPLPAGVEVEVVETGGKTKSGAGNDYAIKTKATGNITLKFTAPGFVPKEETVDIPEPEMKKEQQITRNVVMTPM